MEFAAAVSLIFALLISRHALQRVPVGCVRTVFRRGEFARILPAGLGFILPILERTGDTIPLIGHSVDVDASIFGQAAVHFQILNPDQIGAAVVDPETLVADAAAAEIAMLAERCLDDAAPESMARQVRHALNQRFTAKGLHVVRCQWQPLGGNGVA